MAVVQPPALPPMMVAKSGNYMYVFTYKNKWDPANKRSRRVNSKKVGKIEGGNKEGLVLFDKEFMDTHPELIEFKVSHKGRNFVCEPCDKDTYDLGKVRKLTKLHAGATWALDCILASTPLGRALKRIFSEHNRDLKILSLAYYIVLERTNTMNNYEEFAECTRLPWGGRLCGSSIHRLFKAITADRIDRFFDVLADYYMEEMGEDFFKRRFIALDSTSISTYSALLSKSDFGHNKDGDDELRQINVMMLVDQKTGLPLFYRLYDGAVPDISTVRRTIAEESRMGIATQFVLVSDKGYPSENNINDCLCNQVSFLFNMRCQNQGFVQQYIDEVYADLLKVGTYEPFIGQHAVTSTGEWRYDDYPVQGKNKSRKGKAKVYLHIFYNEDIYTEKKKILMKNTVNVLKKVKEGKKLLPAEQNIRDKYLTEDKENNFSVNEYALNEKLKYAGIKVLLTDCVSNSLEAFTAYAERNYVEYAFNTLKYRLGCNRLRVSDDEALEGKAFVQFIATTLALMVRNRIKKYSTENESKKDSLKFVYSSDYKVLRILNNIFVTKLPEGYLYDEVVGKKRKLFEVLGTELPSSRVIKGQEYTDEDEDQVTESEDELTDEIGETVI